MHVVRETLYCCIICLDKSILQAVKLHIIAINEIYFYILEYGF